MKYYSYENFKVDTNSLIKEVKKFNPQAIVAIARGGLTLAHCVGEGLGIRDVQSIRTELYDASEKRDCISLFGDCEFESSAKVLVLDDIADSGDTFDAVMKNLTLKHPNVVFQSASLFYKKTSCYEPDVWINEADDWIDFFWERDYKQS